MARRLNAETWPQFLTPPLQCGPLEAEEEPGEQDWGEDSGEGLRNVSSAAASLPGLVGLTGAHAQQSLEDRLCPLPTPVSL